MRVVRKAAVSTQMLLKEADSKYVEVNGVRGMLLDVYENSYDKVVGGRLVNMATGQSTYLKHPVGTTVTAIPFSAAEFNNEKAKQAIIVNHRASGCTIGADPELFVEDEKGVVIPAFEFLPKKSTALATKDPNWGLTSPFWDGFQAEFTVPAGTCLEGQTEYVRMQISKLNDIAKTKNPKAKLSYKSVVEIPQEMMAKAKPEHTELGCAPSLNVYNVEPIHVEDPAMLPIRFAGCHMHFGINGWKEEEMQNAVKVIDAVFGIMSVPLFQGLEDERRRIYYGRAGEYRRPKHGLEYRTAGSAMLIHPVVYNMCFDAARAAMYIGKSKEVSSVLWPVKSNMIMSIINNYDVVKAKKLIKANESIFKAIITRRYASYTQTIKDAVLEAVYHGVPHFFNVNTIANNWANGANRVYNWSAIPRKSE